MLLLEPTSSAWSSVKSSSSAKPSNRNRCYNNQSLFFCDRELEGEPKLETTGPNEMAVAGFNREWPNIWRRFRSRWVRIFLVAWKSLVRGRFFQFFLASGQAGWGEHHQGSEKIGKMRSRIFCSLSHRRGIHNCMTIQNKAQPLELPSQPIGYKVC